MQLNRTHDSAARSWLTGANWHAYLPLQNLSFAVFKTTAAVDAFRGGVAIGNELVDLAWHMRVARKSLLEGVEPIVAIAERFD